MKIEIDKILKITNEIFKDIKSRQGNVIVIKEDYYWGISDDEVFDVYKNPMKLTIGQISEDLNFLLEIKKRNELSGIDLQKLLSILFAISKS